MNPNVAACVSKTEARPSPPIITLLFRMRLYRYLRLKLASLGFVPKSRLARLTSYLAAVDAGFFVIEKTLLAMQAAPGVAATLEAWVGLLNFLVVLFGGILLLRWAQMRLMWRLRNRLIVTYVFIGVIPVVLLACMAVIAA